jgi:hypothetical protein
MRILVLWQFVLFSNKGVWEENVVYTDPAVNTADIGEASPAGVLSLVLSASQ